MLRNNPTAAGALATTGDILAILVAWFLSASAETPGVSPVALCVLVVAHLLVTSGNSLHAQLRTVGTWDLLRRVLGSWFRIVLLLGLIALVRPASVPNEAALRFAVFFLGGLITVRFGTMFARHWFRKRGFNLRYVVIAGTGTAAAQIDAAMTGNPGWGLRVAGFLEGEKDAPVTQVPRDRVIGSYEELELVVKTTVIDEIVVADPDASMAVTTRLVDMGRILGLRTHVLANFIPGTWRAVDARQVFDNIVLSLTPFPHDVFGLSTKRALDIVVSGLSLVILSPVFLLIALLIKLDSRGPVFFRQWRVGLNGRLFMFSKFRSMGADAHARLSEFKSRNEMDGPVFKMKSDPRITIVGRYLRRFSLDELPQLWNVLKGEMSLVGPRPLMPHEIDGHLAWQRRRLSMRPGLTCLWQVSGRSKLSFERWMHLDLQYIDSWSLTLDFQILARTLPAVLGGRGAS